MKMRSSVDPFAFTSLTAFINDIPYVPTQIASSGLFKEKFHTTTTVEVEMSDDKLLWVAPSPRNGVGQTRKKATARSTVLTIPHFLIQDYISFEEMQNVRMLGSEDQSASQEAFLRQRMTGHSLSFDLTFELSLLAALQGKIIYADGTVIDLFQKFGLPSPSAAVSMQLATAGTSVETKSRQIQRKITEKMGNTPFDYIKAYCSPDYFDALIQQDSVKETYLNQAAAKGYREQGAYSQVKIGEIIYEEYRGGNQIPEGMTDPLLKVDEAFFFPVSNFIYQTSYAPASYKEAINTIALPRYGKLIPDDADRGVRLEVTTCPLPLNLKPDATYRSKI